MVRKLLALLLVLMLLPVSGAEADFAEKFELEYREDGSAILTVGDGTRFLLLPRESEFRDEGLPVIRIPVERVYAASSSVPDLFLHCGALEQLRFTSTNLISWRIPEIRNAMERSSLLYAGKYSAPDYELLLEEGCDLVIENTMILHTPEVREQLEALGIPVLLEYSSYETHPLGRVEWIRLYGLLTGHEAEAEEFFSSQKGMLEPVEPSGQSIAFFHVNPNGSVSVRAGDDYVIRMIELAGGSSPFRETATRNMQMEAFFAAARDADVLVYNSTVAGELESLEDLLEISNLFSEFKAVRAGNVWCTEQSMFQQSSATAGVIADFRRILSDDAGDALNWLYRLK